MVFDPHEKERHLIPTWQTFPVSVKQGLMIYPRHKDREDLTQGLDALEQDWVSHGTLTYASDFATAALIAGQPQRAMATQEILLEAGGPHTSLGQALANTHAPYGILMGRERGAIRSLLKDNPRSALAWVELARIQYSNGHVEAARKSFSVAVTLAPNNRYILRAQANFHVSIREPDRGLHILRPIASETLDPWLLSAEIAVSELAQDRSKLRRKSRQHLMSHLWPLSSVSELASELATLEDRSGKSARARSLFQLSLNTPTDNSIAQAVDIARQARPQWLVNVLAEHHQERISASAEAAATNAEGAGDFNSAVLHARRWQDAYPFSSRAAAYGSAVAALGAQDWNASAKFAKNGLKVHRNDVTLKNNLAYALIEGGQHLSEARRLISDISRNMKGRQDAQVATLATEGLYAYRIGQYEQGYRLYEKAAQTGQRLKQPRRQALALCLHAREIRDHNDARKKLGQARKLIDANDKLSLHAYELSAQILSRREAQISERPDAY